MDLVAARRLNVFPAGQSVCPFPRGVEDKYGNNIPFEISPFWA